MPIGRTLVACGPSVPCSTAKPMVRHLDHDPTAHDLIGDLLERVDARSDLLLDALGRLDVPERDLRLDLQ